MLICIWTGLRKIPWWAWLIHGVGAIVIASINHFVGGIAAFTLP